MFIIYVSHSEGCGKTIHEITRNGTKLFVLVRVFSWIVLYTVATVQVGLIRHFLKLVGMKTRPPLFTKRALS
jgi:hypothetical protein